MYRIIEGTAEAEIEVKKSRFLAVVANCRSEEEARALIESVKKKHYDARHNCFAFRIGEEKTVFERQSDDGEPQGTAGKPMLEILKGSDLSDVCGVVTRYFGGTLLGTGGLVRAYGDALKAALSAAEQAGRIHELQEGRRLLITCGYSLANRIKYLAEQSGFYTEQEIYTEARRLQYLLPEDAAEPFGERIRDMSGGQAEIEVLGSVLYYGSSKPKVYKNAGK